MDDQIPDYYARIKNMCTEEDYIHALKAGDVPLFNTAYHEFLSKKENKLKDPLNLSGLSLSGIKIPSIRLSFVDLQRSILDNTNLDNADCFSANMSNISLRNASLVNTDLKETILKGSDLRGANLTNAQMDNADLEGTNLIDATFTIEQLLTTKNYDKAILDDKIKFELLTLALQKERTRLKINLTRVDENRNRIQEILSARKELLYSADETEEITK